MGSQDCAPDTKKKFTGLYQKTDSSREDDLSFFDLNATMHPFFIQAAGTSMTTSHFESLNLAGERIHNSKAWSEKFSLTVVPLNPCCDIVMTDQKPEASGDQEEMMGQWYFEKSSVGSWWFPSHTWIWVHGCCSSQSVYLWLTATFQGPSPLDSKSIKWFPFSGVGGS